MIIQGHENRKTTVISADRFLINQKNSRLFPFTWVILALGLIIFPITSHADDGDDLVKAASTGNLSRVLALIEEGVDVDLKNNNGTTALIASIDEGHEEIVHALLDKGANVDQAKNGVTALIMASSLGQETIVQALLTKGAQVNLKDDFGGTALKYARTLKIKKLLKTAGGKENARIPDDEAKRCRYGVDHMIQFAKQSLSEPTSRPERIEKRRKLVEDWSSRLEQGENPCSVYMDIQKAATTF